MAKCIASYIDSLRSSGLDTGEALVKNRGRLVAPEKIEASESASFRFAEKRKVEGKKSER